MKIEPLYKKGISIRGIKLMAERGMTVGDLRKIEEDMKNDKPKTKKRL